jgi:ABC-type antimicrobial peptide transport system permease subunit
VPGLAAALNGLLPSIVLQPKMLAFGLVVAILTGVLSGFLPGLSAMHLRIVNALRRV